MLGRLFSLRRIIYLGFGFMVSLTIMCIIWPGYQQRLNINSKREEIELESFEEPILKDSVSALEQNTSFVEYILKETTYSGIGPILENHSPIQRASTNRPPIDYGKDRDLDVEGVADYVLWYENFHKETPQLPVIPRQQKCTKPVINIAFLKTHYTGSDVITNILNRFGDLRNLRVALPNDGLSTFYWPMRFQWKYIDITLLNGSLPNIISNHARYNGDVMDNIMSPGTMYISLLRDPVRQLETTFNNLRFADLLGIYNASDTLETFLIDPKSYIRGVIKRKRFKDSLNLIKNAMFFDLGLSTTEYHKKNIIKATIYELYEKFSVVMIYEYFDESLVLLKRKLCWEIDDILYFKFHHTVHNIWNREEFTSELREMIRIWNSADTALYDFFNKTLWEEIAFEGEEFWSDLKQFRRKLKEIENDCIGDDFIDEGSSVGLSNLQSESSPVRLNPEVSLWNKYLCEKLLMNELEYIDYFRKKDSLSKLKSKR